ncbi:stage III sporulation protein AD [Clostridium sp.]|uniref:stage III sporulation protein AD n=1 Tax=Clostridium sp. TaxID=1506 RepID=UPI0026029818|nr:stage III sporulation protein AD [Clostridium sp.]
MDVLVQVICFSLISMFLYLFLKELKSPFAVMLLLISGIIIFLFIMPYLNEIITFMHNIAKDSGMDSTYIGIVMKVIAIAYLSTFCSYICNDAGVTVLGKKVEFAGKIMILLLAIPIMINILNSILSIM